MASSGEKSLAVGHIADFQIDPMTFILLYHFLFKFASADLSIDHEIERLR